MLVAAGYFDAPAAIECPLLHVPMEPLPSVTMVFCALEGLPAMKVCLKCTISFMQCKTNLARRIIETCWAIWGSNGTIL